MGNSSEEESEPSPMWEDTSGEKLDKWADKIKWSSAFISELMAHVAKSLDAPRLFRNIKKMLEEDQEGWLKVCCCKVRRTQESILGCQGLHSSLRNWFWGNLLTGCTVWNHTYTTCTSHTGGLGYWVTQCQNRIPLGKLDEEIYMEQPEGYIKKGQEGKVCCLLKSLYGLKQSALQWNT